MNTQAPASPYEAGRKHTIGITCGIGTVKSHLCLLYHHMIQHISFPAIIFLFLQLVEFLTEMSIKYVRDEVLVVCVSILT